MIKSVENLEVGDTFNIGNTPVKVVEPPKPVGHSDANLVISLTTRYSDGGQIVELTLIAPKKFLVET